MLRALPRGEVTFRDEIYGFLRRRPHAPPHAHACPSCYEDEICGLDCAIEPDLQRDNGTSAGSHEVCSRCERRFSEVIRGNAAILGCWADDGGLVPDPDPLAQLLERPDV